MKPLLICKLAQVIRNIPFHSKTIMKYLLYHFNLVPETPKIMAIQAKKKKTPIEEVLFLTSAINLASTTQG